MPKKGFTLIAAIFIVVGMAILGLTTVALVASDSGISVKNYKSLQAFYIADAGLEYYLKQLADSNDWSVPPPVLEEQDFNNGVLTLAVLSASANQVTFSSTGRVTQGLVSYERVLAMTVTRDPGGVGGIISDYLIYGGSGGGATNVGNNVVINGAIFVDADLIIDNNSFISGDAYASGEITLGGGASVTGTIEPSSDLPTTFPTLETTFYDGLLAQAALQPAGDWTITTSTLFAAQSPYLVNGNVTFQGGETISTSGSVIVAATGNVSVGNNAIIGDNLSVIAGGSINMANNVTLGKSGSWYSAGDLDVGNNFEIGGVGSGEGTAFLAKGDIQLGNLDVNDGKFNGLIFCEGDFIQTGNNFHFEGNILAGHMGLVGNNATLLANPTLVSLVDIPAFGVSLGEVGEIELTNWQETY